MMARHMKWTEYCAARGLPQMVDILGTTAWGRATLDVLDLVEVTAVSASPDGQARIDRLTKRGVLRVCYRRHGRLYHPLTNLPKVDRRRILINGKPTAEVDMSAAFTTLLASGLPEADRKPIVDKVRAGTWYKQFDATYDAFAKEKRAEMEAAGCSEQEISERLCGVKVEFQRQVLFGSDRRKASTPLFDVLRRNHPALAQLIDYLRQLYGVSGFASWLMHKESAIFVDRCIPEAHRFGVQVLGIHDGLIVPVEDAGAVGRMTVRVSRDLLGFDPGVSVKGPQVVHAAQV